jgi:hypothetical protein
MNKTMLAAGALCVLLASNAFAQQDLPGEARALPSAPASKAEKQAARQHRNAVSKEMVRTDEGRLEDLPESAGTPRVSPQERAAARAQRRAAGVAATQDDKGRLPESPTAR